MNDQPTIVHKYARVDRFPDYLSPIQYGKFKFLKICISSRKIAFGDKSSIEKLTTSCDNLIRITHSSDHNIDHVLQKLLGSSDVLPSDANGRIKTQVSTEDNVLPNCNHNAAGASILPEKHEPVTLCILQTEHVGENNEVEFTSKAKDLLSPRNTSWRSTIYILDSKMRPRESGNIYDKTNLEVRENMFVYTNEKLQNELKNVLTRKLSALFESLNDILKSWKIEISRASTEMEEMSKTKTIDEIENLMKTIKDMRSLFSVRTLPNELTEELKNDLWRYKTRGLTAYVYCFGKLSVYVSNQTENNVKTEIYEMLKPHFDRVEMITTNESTMIKPLADIVPGSQLCQEGHTKSGTLGCFGRLDDPSSLVAITGFHVIATKQKAVIKLRNNQTIPLGTCIWGYQPPVNRVNLSDIGVIEIPSGYRASCKQRNIDRGGSERSLVLNTKPSSFFETKYVFKRGGSTGLTNGYIISNEAAHFLDGRPCDLLIVESNSAEEDNPFADEGDCGGVVVWHPTDDPDSMYALSFIVGCVDIFQNLPAGSVVTSRMDGAFERFKNGLKKQLHII